MINDVLATGDMPVNEDSEAYARWLEKFKTVKTTDDCYTPPQVYDAVLAWVRKRHGIPADAPIVRPFYPGGNYEAYDYPPGCVVVDNPPFSISTQVVRHYMARKIRFFLFSNGLTLLNAMSPRGFRFAETGVGVVVTVSQVRYRNGAVVNTGFVTNMGENAVECAPDLARAIRDAMGGGGEKRSAVVKSGYALPPSVATMKDLMKLARYGAGFGVPKGEALFVKGVGGRVRKNIMGGGLLLSRQSAEKMKEALMSIDRKDANIVRLKLSADEARMQRLLDANSRRRTAVDGSTAR